MDHPFQSVEEEKRNRIINNGLKEFATQGGKRSSLNTILKESNISKGFFYHYFKNKQEFYNYLLEYGVRIIIEKLNNQGLLEERDFVKRLQTATLYKTQISLEHPRLFDFFTEYYNSISHEEYVAFTSRIGGDFANRVLTENIDYSLFRDDIPRDVVMKVVSKYIGQIQTELSALINVWSYKKIAEHYNKELEDLKQVVYKKGEQ